MTVGNSDGDRLMEAILEGCGVACQMKLVRTSSR